MASCVAEGRIASVEGLRKKGSSLIRVALDGGKSVQLVVSRDVQVGQRATVVLEGAVLDNGMVCKRKKVTGEWSEGVLLAAHWAPQEAAAAVPAPAGSRAAAVAEVPRPRPVMQAKSRGAGLTCPLMNSEEAASITIPFEEIEARLTKLLDLHGVAIVTGVASEEECADMEKLFAEDLAELIDGSAARAVGGAVATAAATVEPLRWPMASMTGLGGMERCQLRGLPHGRFAWACRLHPRVRRAYAVIHGTDALTSSCDNSFFAPLAHPETAVNRSWPHVDHNMHDQSMHDEAGEPIGQWDVFQGALYVWDATSAHASTTVVWPSSHREVYEEVMANEAMQRIGRKGVHFSSLSKLKQGPASQLEATAWPAAARRVPVPAGALLLWSSRTVHQGWSGGPRLAQPVCWEPVGRRSESARERKLRMAALGLPSTHWASLGMPHTLVRAELPEPTSASGQPGNVRLPLVRTLRPVTLASGVEVGEMWELLQGADWNQALRPELKELLERSIAPKFRDVL